jgi:NTP pyrophosphatase (non-canonical NTP hydrolase)
MTLDEYAAWAATIKSRATRGSREKLLAYLAIGLAAEAGEVAGEFKDMLRDGKLDRDEAIEELGNVIYYWARLCRALRISPTKVLMQSQKEIGGVVTKAKRPTRRRAKRVAKRRR